MRHVIFVDVDVDVDVDDRYFFDLMVSAISNNFGEGGPFELAVELANPYTCVSGEVGCIFFYNCCTCIIIYILNRRYTYMTYVMYHINM